MPAKPSHMQTRVPGTTKDAPSNIHDIVTGDGYHYVIAEPRHDGAPAGYNAAGHRELKIRNSLTSPGKRMYERVTDENIVGLLADPEMEVYRCSNADYRAQLKKDEDWAKSRVSPQVDTGDPDRDYPNLDRVAQNPAQVGRAREAKFTLVPDAEGIPRDVDGYGPDAGKEGWSPN